MESKGEQTRKTSRTEESISEHRAKASEGKQNIAEQILQRGAKESKR